MSPRLCAWGIGLAKTAPERIREHKVWTDLDDLDQRLAEAEPLLEEGGPEDAAAHASLVALAKHTREVLKSANPVLVSEIQLNAVDAPLTTIIASVGQVPQLGNPAQLVSAATIADQVLSPLAVIPVVKSRSDIAGVTEAVGDFHRHLGEILEAVETRSNTMQEELAELDRRRADLTAEIESQKGVLATAISTFETQSAGERTARGDEFTAAFQDVQEKLEAAEKQANTYYQDDEARHVEQMNQFQTEFDELKVKLDNLAQETAEGHAAQATETITNLEDQLAKGKRLVEMIGEVTMTGHYQRNAKEQKTEADQWRKQTVGAAIVAVPVAAVVLVWGLIHPADRDWFTTASRLGVAIALGGLAAYLGNQARLHRHRETTYRALELELATLDPFLSSLDEETRHQLKAQLAPRYFVGVDPDARILEEPVQIPQR